MAEDGLTIGFRFPFGRYAATPWYVSRREHVVGVEWPPSPWRIGRALIAVADQFGSAADLASALNVARRLGETDPVYRLPPTAPLHYAQWMPQLAYTDSIHSGERGDNGHTLLALDPNSELTVHWPGLVLATDELEALDRLLARMPFLGQSVSACRARRLAEPAGKNGEAGSASPGEPADLFLLAPTPGATDEELMASTDARGSLVKAQPVPPGSRWRPYRVLATETKRRSQPQPRPAIAAVTLRLAGVSRPPAPRPGEPRDEALEVGWVARALRRSLPVSGDAVEAVELIDDDLDGRAERVRVRLANGARAGRLLEVREIAGWIPEARASFRCEATLDAVEWAGAARAGSAEAVLDPEPVCFALTGARRPLLADAITVAETAHRRLLGVAARIWGPGAIPARLSGRSADGQPLRDHNRHAHFLLGADPGPEITHLMLWGRDGFTAAERRAIERITLPALAGAALRLRPSEHHPALGPARRWRTSLPFLPTRHPKRRAGRIRDSIEDQVLRELTARGLPEPVRIEPTDQDWSMVRTLRRARDRSLPHLGAHGFELEFDQPVEGPIALGRNCHFSMGLFTPEPDGG